MIVLLMEINDYEIGFEGNGIQVQYDTMATRTFGKCHLAIDFKQYCEIYLLYESVCKIEKHFNIAHTISPSIDY